MDDENGRVDEGHISRDTEVMIGVPAEPLPGEFINELKAALGDEQEISAAYVFLMGAEGSEPDVTIGVQAEGPVESERMKGISNTVLNRVKQFMPGTPITFLELSDPGFLASVKEITQPVFYR